MALTPSPTTSLTRRRDFGNPIVQIVLLLIVLVLFSWFVLKPKLAQTLDRRNELKAARQQMERIEADQRELNRLVNELRSAPDEVALVDEALPLSGRVSKVHVLLDNLVRSSGMSLTQISAPKTDDLISAGDKAELANPYQSGRKLYTINVSVSVNGTMDQLRNLLQLIESNGRVLDVTSVEMVGGEPATRFRIDVKAYAYEN